jgi:hypothetical protein
MSDDGVWILSGERMLAANGLVTASVQQSAGAMSAQDLQRHARALLAEHDAARLLLALTSITGAVSRMAADATGQRSEDILQLIGEVLAEGHDGER